MVAMLQYEVGRKGVSSIRGQDLEVVTDKVCPSDRRDAGDDKRNQHRPRASAQPAAQAGLLLRQPQYEPGPRGVA